MMDCLDCLVWFVCLDGVYVCTCVGIEGLGGEGGRGGKGGKMEE